MAPWSRSTPCERAAQWISLALDDELSGLEAAALERHLSRCAECTAFAGELAQTTELVRTAPLEPMRVPVQTGGGGGRRRVPPSHRAALALASLAAVASAAGVFILGSPVTIQGPEALASWNAAQRARALDGVHPGREPSLPASARAPLTPSPFLARARA